MKLGLHLYIVRNSVLAFTVLSSLLGLSGCADLDEISQFAKTSDAVGKSFPGIANEAQASCFRANGFINTSNPLQPLPCDTYTLVNPLLTKINSALFDYVSSLGKLAGANLTLPAGAFDKLQTDLKQADPKISTEEQTRASAAGALAKAVTDLVTRGYREGEVSKIIRDSDPSVQSVTAFLSDYAAGKYTQSLKDEWRLEESYCINMATNAEPLATDLLKRKCAADKFRIDKQLKGVDDYKRALSTIAETHGKLNEQRGHWEPKEMIKVLGPAIVSLGSASVSINGAFSEGK